MDDWKPRLLRPAKRRFWVFSDLQQHDPANARRCMHAGVEDFLSLRLPVDAACYLGDSTEGTDLGHLREMADMQVEALARVDAPVWYVMGNHEFDFQRWSDPPPTGRVAIPMRERILGEKQWHTTASTVSAMLFSESRSRRSACAPHFSASAFSFSKSRDAI